MGPTPADTAALTQRSVTISATRTTYEFGNARVRVTFSFLTPSLPSDLDLLSRPVTYLTWTVASSDGKPHKVQVYFDCGAEIAVNTPDQSAGLDYPQAAGLLVARVGTPDQPVLARKGDDVRIDWGYGYLATPSGAGAVVAGGNSGRMRRAFMTDGAIAAPAGPIAARPVADSRLAMAAAWDFGEVGATPVARFAMLAYDDVFAIRYFSQDLRAYWRRNGATIESVLATAAREREALDAKSAAFDADLRRDLTQAGGAKYAGDRDARLPPDAGGHQARRRRERAAAALPQGELQQRLHRHGGRDLPDGAAVPAVRPDAGARAGRVEPRLREFAALEVPVRAARPRHLSARHRPGLRRRREDRGEPDAGRGDRQHDHPRRGDRADGRERGLRGPVLAGA